MIYLLDANESYGDDKNWNSTTTTTTATEDSYSNIPSLLNVILTNKIDKHQFHCYFHLNVKP